MEITVKASLTFRYNRLESSVLDGKSQSKFIHYSLELLLVSRIISGTRFYEIQTNTKTLGSHVSSELIDSPSVIDHKIVFRRYTDFEALYNELIDQNLDHFIPPIPEKSYEDKLSKDDSKFVLTRMRHFEQFLNDLVNDPVLGQCTIVMKFLTMNER